MPFFRLVLACALLPHAFAQTNSLGLSLVQRHSFTASHGEKIADPSPLSGESIGTISSSSVLTNNLGGQGPVLTDPHVITLKDAFSVGSDPITVVMSNLTHYAPASQKGVSRNGKGADGTDPFALINIKCATSTQVRLEFFQWTNGSMVPVLLETVSVAFLDLDSGTTGLKEYIGVSTPFVTHYLTNQTELESYSIPGWNGTAWISTKAGDGSNNPIDPDGLTRDQMTRSVMVEFANVTYVDTLLGVSHQNNCHGRNILFAFTSNMDSTPPPTSSPTSSPTPAKTQAPTPSPTPSPTKLNNDCGTCVIWGDPHIITFKAHQRRLAQHPRREEFFRTRGWASDQLNVKEAGRHWLVKSERVKIQGRYDTNETSGMTFLASLVFGGPFLEGRVLNIQPLNGKVTWEGDEILPSIPSVFKNDLVHATYHNAAKMVKDGTIAPGIDVELPQGVTLTVNRWRNMLAAEISMCQIEEQSGQCGSYANESY